ncbi:MAG TPA: MFS transporter [Thermoleophilaceae bacterium]|jgi:MFS family permease
MGGRGRDLRLLVGAVGLSALGDALAMVPLMLYLEDETGSGLAVAALLIALWGPVAVLAPVAGALVDRVETRGLLLVVSLAQAAVVAVLAFVSAPAAVVALAALVGVGFAVAQPAEFALVPGVAGAGRVQEANGHVETARYLGWLLGPLLGALLAAGGGTRAALLVNAATFLAVAAAAGALGTRRPPEPADPGARERARDGFAFLLGDRLLAPVMLVAFVSFLFFAASTPAEVFFAKDDLDSGELGYGALITAWTVGMGVGATVIARRVPARLLATGALVAVGVQGAGMAGATVHLALWVAVAAFVAGGFGLGAKNVLVRTLVHERVPDRLHGRAFAAYNGIRNAAELVALAAGGTLVATAGARWTLVIAGVVPLAAAALALGRVRGRGPARVEARAA